MDNCYEDWIDDNWISLFFEKCKSYGLNEILNNTKVVTFNYERTFEFFAERYLTKHFGALDKDVKKSFFEKNVKHVYGKIDSIDSTPFGSFNNDETEKMKLVFQNFSLMYFDRKDLVWSTNEYFDQTLFIGFGYDKENLAKLYLDKINCPVKQGTGHGISPDLLTELKSQLGIEIYPSLTCKEFIKKQII